jgi:hypothetical protein
MSTPAAVAAAICSSNNTSKRACSRSEQAHSNVSARGTGNRVVGVAIGGAKLHRYAAVALLDGPENQWQSFADHSIAWLV